MRDSGSSVYGVATSIVFLEKIRGGNEKTIEDDSMIEKTNDILKTDAH